ncbi:MAG: hypothetical protein KDA96_11470, partial [Planctomycetaceae bacterium]|nr:hypothetical protein [Planctomycetaceae bacterium]
MRVFSPACRWLRNVCVLTALLGTSTASAVADDGETVTLRIRFGLKDQKPTDWGGSLALVSGSVEAIRGWRWSDSDSAEGNSWSVRTRRRPAQSAAERKRIADGQQMPMNDNGILVTLRGVRRNDPIRFQTQPASLTFSLNDLSSGRQHRDATGSVLIELVPTVQPLATTQADEDYPAVAVGSDGTVYAVYLAFTRGRDFQGVRERPSTPASPAPTLGAGPVKYIENPLDFDYLAQPTGGEQLFLRILKDNQWSDPIAVTDGQQELYRPAISVDGSGRVWVLYSAHVDPDENLDDGNWELFARSFAADGTDPSTPVNVSHTVGADFMPAATTDSRGQVWVAWVGSRGSSFHVFTAHQDGSGFSAPQRVSEFSGNEWEPAIAADRSGHVTVAWDTFEKGDYDVYVATTDGDSLSDPQAVAASLAFEVRPSAAYDSEGRLWIAYEYSGDQWGKDFGALKKKGIPLYQTGRSVRVRVRDSQGRWAVPPDVMDAMPTDRPQQRRGRGNRQQAGPGNRQPVRTPVQSIAPTYPRLTCDHSGHVWLAFRGKPGTNWRVNVGSVWCEYLTCLGADGWTDAVWVPHTNNILDNRPAIAAIGNSEVALVFSGDGRGEVDPLDETDVHLPGASDDADVAPADVPPTQPRRGRRGQQTDPNNQVLYTIINAAAFAPGDGPVELTPVEAEVPAAPAADVVEERSDVQRMRDYRVQLGDESLQIWRGEFHRHTELSPDGGGDGGLLDMWRYAIDAAAMDWIGDGDHDYGVGREYSWWTTQKAVTLFTLPEHFTPVYSYERSVRYPEGHRNCMFDRRGIRSLPRLPISSPDEFASAPDTQMLYKYLHYFGGLCASHTSATDMGTDWRDNDPEVEPLVEIYQGDRNNYERPDSPRSAVTEAKLKQSTPEQE